MLPLLQVRLQPVPAAEGGANPRQAVTMMCTAVVSGPIARSLESKPAAARSQRIVSSWSRIRPPSRAPVSRPVALMGGVAASGLHAQVALKRAPAASGLIVHLFLIHLQRPRKAVRRKQVLLPRRRLFLNRCLPLPAQTMRGNVKRGTPVIAMAIKRVRAS